MNNSKIQWHGDIALSSSTVTIFSKEKKQTHTNRKEQKLSSDVVPWGDNNRYPQELLEAIEKTGAAGGGMRVLRAAHYGRGFSPFTNEKDEDGKRKINEAYLEDYPEVYAFWQQSKMKRFWLETIADLETFSVAFPEFILSSNFQKIVSVRRQKAAWCRFEPMDEKTGLIKNVCIDTNWQSATKGNYTQTVPVMDSYWTAEQIREYCKQQKIYKFILPIFYPMINEAYYPVTDWHASYKNGWMEVASKIPEYKKFLFENQINLKFIVYVSEEYFTRLYRDEWDEFLPDRKKELREQLTNAINDHLSGNKSAGKSIGVMKYLTEDGNWEKGIEIEAIDNKLKDGTYLPEASAANSEILFGQGVDPTLLGAGIPGGKLGAGSGSDKRVAFSILSSLMKSRREITLEPWEFLKAYNGWPLELQGGFADTTITTLDANPTGSQSTRV